MPDLLPSIVLNPKETPIGSVIWLHGLGADGNDFVPIVSELNLPNTLPLRFVFPHAPMMPVTINNGYQMRAWYDIVSMSIDQRADQAGIDASRLQLHNLIEHEKKLGIPTDKIILAGFSQGAVIALTTGLTFPERLGGILALSGYLPAPEKILNEMNDANRTTPIFLAHGREDNIVPHMLGDQVYHLLQKKLLPVSWHSYAMGHSVCMEEVRDIASWLKKIL
jgi:phospholipase/carboxylesterase